MSPGPDTLIQSALERRNLLALMAALPLLRDLSPMLLEEIAREVEWFSLPGGTTLFNDGDAVDGLYVVVNGVFGVYVASPAGGARLAGQIGAGETAGEMEVISGGRRTATLISLRNSEVARLPVRTFEKLVASHPQSLRRIANNLIQRIEALQRPEVLPDARPKTFAIVPNGLEVDAAAFGLSLAEQLRRFGRAQLVLSSEGSDRTSPGFTASSALTISFCMSPIRTRATGANCACGKPIPCCCWRDATGRRGPGRHCRQGTTIRPRPRPPKSSSCTKAPKARSINGVGSSCSRASVTITCAARVISRALDG
jgi:CRP-like cAMP-binding protein